MRLSTKAYFTLGRTRNRSTTVTSCLLSNVALSLAVERGTGARALRQILEGIMLDLMYHLPEMEGDRDLVIDETMVPGCQF